MVHSTEDFLGFMDHSPSEQLYGEPDLIHTTAIYLSKDPNAAKAKLDQFAKKVRNTEGELIKWSKVRKARKEKFVNSFLTNLHMLGEDSGSRVFISAASESVIEALLPDTVRMLGLENMVREVDDQGRHYLTFIGLKDTEGNSIELKFLYSEAVMTLWIARSLVVAYEALYQNLKMDSEDSFGLDIFFYMDKLSSNNPDRYAILTAILKRRVSLGMIQLYSFKESDQVLEELFVDNLAGVFSYYYLNYEKNKRKIPLPKNFLHLDVRIERESRTVT